MEDGIVIGMGLLLTIVKAPVSIRIWLLSRPFLVDVIVFILLCVLHGGSPHGMLVAGVGAATCSVALSLGRRMYGYKHQGVYVPGFFNCAAALGVKK